MAKAPVVTDLPSHQSETRVTALQGRASLLPWHTDYYVIHTPLSLDALREHIEVSNVSYREQLEWHFTPVRGRRGLRFVVWPVDYIGPYPGHSTARCVAQTNGDGSVITVSIRAALGAVPMIVISALAILAASLSPQALGWFWFIIISSAWIGLDLLALWQVRRRDPPQRLATRIAASLNGIVTTTRRPPREPFRL
jgi:hypothetical protein